jgi:hypothetical protein
MPASPFRLWPTLKRAKHACKGQNECKANGLGKLYTLCFGHNRTR